MPTLSTTLGKNMQLKAQFGHKSRPAGGNFGLTDRSDIEPLGALDGSRLIS